MAPKNTDTISGSPLRLTRIDTVWMAVAVDNEDGVEGICGMLVGDAWMPLLAGDADRLPYIREKAEQIARTEKRLVKIVRLHHREEVEEFDGRS